LSRVRYLADQHLPRRLRRALQSREPGIDIFRVGDPGAPPLGTQDPELLRFAESEGRILLSHDWNTIPDHIRDHQATGRHTAGVFFVKPLVSWDSLLEFLVLVWSASEAEEWRDRMEYIPW
jgi:hypothetical protein